MKDQRKAHLYALLTVLLWSTVAAAFKMTLRYLDPIQLLFHASAVSTGVLGLILLFQGRLRETLSSSRDQWLRSLCLGILNPFLYYLILFKAYDLLPAQVAQPLNYTWALTLTLLSIPLLRQTIRARDIAAGLTCYLGVVIIASRGTLTDFHAFDPLGVVLALASTVVWSLSWILNTKDAREPVTGLFLSFLCGLPFIFATLMVTSGPAVEDYRGLLGAAYVGVFEMGITFVFWLQALKHSENTSRVANLIFLSPFLSLVIIHLVVGEEIHRSTVLGLVLILTGLLAQHDKPAVREAHRENNEW